MKYIDAEKLITEIERLQHLNESYKRNWRWKFKWFSRTVLGRLEVLEGIKNFINSQQEQPEVDENNPEPYNPVYDEDYLNEKIAKATKSWEGVDVDKMLADCRGYEEPDNSLEEAAEKYVDEECSSCDYIGAAAAENAFKAGAKWQKNEDKETIEVAEDHAFMAGSVWQKEQILKEAVDLEKEMDRFFEEMPIQEHENIFEDTYHMIARHFYELGLKTRKEE